MTELVADVQRAVDEWFAQRANPYAAYSAISVPVEALPILQRIWAENA